MAKIHGPTGYRSNTLVTDCGRFLCMLGFSLALATPVTGQQRDLTLWVTLGDSDQLVEVNPYTYGEIRRIKVDPRPHGLAVSADGGTVYLASDKTGNFQVIDVRTGRITGQVNIGNDPNQMTLTKDGKFAYVPIRGDSKIAVVQLDPLKLVKLLPSPAGPHDAYTSADGTRIYVGAQYGSAISVIDPATQSVLHTIPTADGVRPLEPSADGKTIYVALSNLLGFVVVDPSTRQQPVAWSWELCRKGCRNRTRTPGPTRCSWPTTAGSCGSAMTSMT